jgi:amidase
VELAGLIRRREVSSREVVGSHLTRIEQVNGRLNAIAVVMAEEALTAAAAADELTARGGELGPLHGVPFTVKENIDVAGTATTMGVAALLGAVANEDAPVVASLRTSGAIPIGRTNLPDFALRWHTDGSAHGATLNPWDPTLTPGGSSGGEAAAIVTGMSPLGVGNDLGGSLRWPAQCCGIVSLKPTLGRVPSATVIPPLDPPMGIQLTMCQGPMARNVADLRVAFSVMCSPSSRDPWFAPVAPPAEGSSTSRVALIMDPIGAGLDASVARGLQEAARALRRQGYMVEEVTTPPPFKAAVDVWAQLLSFDAAALLAHVGPILGQDGRLFLETFGRSAPEVTPADYIAAMVQRHALLREWSAFLAQWPLVLAPISTRPPFKAGFDLEPTGPVELLTALAATVAVNAMGLPAASVNVTGNAPEPMAVQLIGGRFREGDCLDAAAAIERELGARMPIDPRGVPASVAAGDA